MPLKHFMCSATNLFSFRRARIRTSTVQTTTKNTKLNRQQNENAITAHVVMMVNGKNKKIKHNKMLHCHNNIIHLPLNLISSFSRPTSGSARHA